MDPSHISYASDQALPDDQLIDHAAIERALQDYNRIHIPPDFVAPAVPSSFLRPDKMPVHYPFGINTGAFNASLTSTPFAQPSSDASSLSYNPTHTPTHTPAITPHHSPHNNFPLLNPSPNIVGVNGSSRQQHSSTPDLSHNMPPPLRIHLHQPSATQQSFPASTHPQNTAPGSDFTDGNININNSGTSPNGAWAMELLKGYKTTQAGLNFPWSGWSATSAISPPPPQSQPRAGPSRHSATAGLPVLSTPSLHSKTSTPQLLPIATPQKGNSRKRSANDVSPPVKTSEAGRSSAASNKNGDAEGDGDENGLERKQVIACYTCRARKLK